MHSNENQRQYISQRFYHQLKNMINTKTLREELHDQINHLPDEIVQQIADFSALLMSRRKIEPLYEDWNEKLWQDFSLHHFFAEDDDVEYSLADAKEVYRA